MKRLLILSANPHSVDQLKLAEEVRDIEEGLKRSAHRDQFELIDKGAVRLQDFRRHMLEVKPQILHFSGHGAGEHGLVLEGDRGQMQLLQTEQLAGMFKLFATKGLECVVLNACYSEVQAKAMNQFIPYVIGMNQAIGDRAAMTFSVAFYDTLGAGETVDFAFELAKTQLIGLQEDHKPQLLKNLDLIASLNASMPQSDFVQSDRSRQPEDLVMASPEQPKSKSKDRVQIEMKAGDNAKQIGHIEKVETINF